MKKFIVLAVLLFGGLNSPKALEIVIDNGEALEEREYRDNYVDGINAYLISPYIEYELTDRQRINNLAYLGKSSNEKIIRATIQKMIWKTMYPESNFTLKDNDEIINTKQIEEQIESKLEMYKIDFDIDESNYEINLDDELVINSKNDLIGFYTLSYSMDNYSNKIRIRAIKKTGLHKIDFENRVDIKNNLVYGLRYYYNPFTIYVNVLGNTGIINIANASIYNYTFKMYDLDDNYLKDVNINQENNEFYYEKGQDIKLVDISEELEDIVIKEEDNKDVYEVNIEAPVKNYELILNTLLMDYKVMEKGDLIGTNISVKNKNNEVVASCKSFDGCTLVLPMGDYKIIDNITNREEEIYLYNDENITINRYFINGLKTTEVIKEIRKSDVLINFEHKNNTYIFDEGLIPDIYNVLIDDQIYEIDLTKSENYVFLENEGLFYNFNLEMEDDERKEDSEPVIDDNKPDDANKEDSDPVINDNKEDKVDIEDNGEGNGQTSSKEDEVIIEVPNTGVDGYKMEAYDYKKKYVYLDTNVNYIKY